MTKPLATGLARWSSGKTSALAMQNTWVWIPSSDLPVFCFVFTELLKVLSIQCNYTHRCDGEQIISVSWEYSWRSLYFQQVRCHVGSVIHKLIVIHSTRPKEDPKTTTNKLFRASAQSYEYLRPFTSNPPISPHPHHVLNMPL